MRAVMALSGGMDSSALLCRLLADGYKVSCISYDFGQKHVVEIDSRPFRSDGYIQLSIDKQGYQSSRRSL